MDEDFRAQCESTGLFLLSLYFARVELYFDHVSAKYYLVLVSSGFPVNHAKRNSRGDLAR
ncbi:MAG TPA: hypothetical protein DCY55_00880 [Gammaproteobacteria bacterium]|nr:hypothetical protein [Gammaproteobacteria bacterium]